MHNNYKQISIVYLHLNFALKHQRKKQSILNQKHLRHTRAHTHNDPSDTLKGDRSKRHRRKAAIFRHETSSQTYALQVHSMYEKQVRRRQASAHASKFNFERIRRITCFFFSYIASMSHTLYRWFMKPLLFSMKKKCSNILLGNLNKNNVKLINMSRQKKEKCFIEVKRSYLFVELSCEYWARLIELKCLKKTLDKRQRCLQRDGVTLQGMKRIHSLIIKSVLIAFYFSTSMLFEWHLV